MVYTVKKLAELSKVTVRTLHFYDEAGLLKPAYYGNNGYRYYEEEQLLRLQQILFFRELGFEIKKIQKILGKGDFDKVAALNSHRVFLKKEVKRFLKLIETIDKTIDHLQGKKTMNDDEMYMGFSKEEQAKYEEFLKNRIGADLVECEENVKHWTKSDWEKSHQSGDKIWKEFVVFYQKKYSPSAAEVQSTVGKLYDWVKQFWTPNRKSFIGLGQGYTDYEWKKFFCKYDPDHPKLAMYVAEAMKIFAERELG